MVRGDVFEITLPTRRGRVQHGRRYAVVVQTNDLLDLSTVVICPTSRSSPAASFHPAITLHDEETLVMCEMIGAVDGRALSRQVGHLSFDEMRAVDDAVLMVLDLN